MQSIERFIILPQPDEITCGPTCLHSLYRHYGDDISLSRVIDEIPMLESGGTLAVNLACHALSRDYRAIIYTYKMQLFDPTWLLPGGPDIRERLRKQMDFKDDPRLHAASLGYLQFLDRGGELRFEDLTPQLIRGFLKRRLPIIAGLSATYLYRSMREFGPNCLDDDLRGEPCGHFVVMHGYDQEQQMVHIADPFLKNPMAEEQSYAVNMHRAICSILLGVLTYDANLLIIYPQGG